MLILLCLPKDDADWKDVKNTYAFATAAIGIAQMGQGPRMRHRSAYVSLVPMC